MTGAAPPRIPVFAPAIGLDTVRHLAEALEAGWLGMGATTKLFEESLLAYLGEPNRKVVATNTGTSALHLGLLAAGVKSGDEVITPSFNYVADHQAITMAGGNVVMCDIQEDNLGIDCKKAEELISSRTKAIIPLHFAGVPCDQRGVYSLAKKHGLRVVEDACHALGTTIDGRKIGSYGDIAVFSFDPVKIVTSIDGGAVVVNSADEHVRLQRLRLLGVDRDTVERYKNRRAWDYDVIDIGFRYHLTNILASVGVSQLRRIDEFIAGRQEVCRRYNQAFRRISGLTVLPYEVGNVSPFIYSLRVPGGQREPLIDFLRERGIDAGIHFIPVHRHTQFAAARRGPMDVTDRVCKEVVTLPLHSVMAQSLVTRVIEGVEGFFGR